MGKSLWRAMRISVAAAASMFLVTLFKNEQLIWLTPVIAGLGKLLREKHPKTYDWIPF